MPPCNTIYSTRFLGTFLTAYSFQKHRMPFFCPLRASFLFSLYSKDTHILTDGKKTPLFKKTFKIQSFKKKKLQKIFVGMHKRLPMAFNPSAVRFIFFVFLLNYYLTHSHSRECISMALGRYTCTSRCHDLYLCVKKGSLCKKRI